MGTGRGVANDKLLDPLGVIMQSEEIVRDQRQVLHLVTVDKITRRVDKLRVY